MKVRYLNITIGDHQVQVTNPEALPFSVNYSLEDPQNFQQKPAGSAVGIELPATLLNDKAANQFHNIDSVDTTPDEQYRSHQPFAAEANGLQILTGKAFLEDAVHGMRPKSYKYNFYGDNADWVIDLQEKNLYDFIKHITFTLDKSTIEASWAYDGHNEALPLVFAPVKYRGPMGGYTLNAANESVPVDDNMLPIYMRPALSIYWILYWGLKSAGYRLQSNFFDSDYFRRMVMPWTWGNFIDSDGTKLNTHKFLAKGVNEMFYNARQGRTTEIWNMQVSNDSTDGAFDNNQGYTWDAATGTMTWEYKAPDFGTLEANFAMMVNVEAFVNQNSDMDLRIQWRHNGVQFDGGFGAYNTNGNLIMSLASNAGIGTGRNFLAMVEMFCTRIINHGDTITAQIYRSTFRSKAGDCWIKAQVLEYRLAYFRIPLGGTINFANFTGFQKVKWLDLFRGVLDTFNISINTDSISKVVVMEPTHPYSLTNNLSTVVDGYFKNDWINWEEKRDLSKDWTLENYADYEREVTFCFKDDTNDGILKKIQDRHITTLAASKYVFPQRFKKGKKEVPNRFFSPVMHYEAEQWKGITGVAPQLICIIPENISNTSNTESNNTFAPKLAYYKGLVSGAGGWKWDGQEQTNLPFLFAVNYKEGGQNDPILSYSDENIAGTWGKGLLRRFFLQRLATMRNGQVYSTAFFRLNETDITSMHREYIMFAGHRYELVQIRDYRPLQEGSTACYIRRWTPVEERDSDSVFPTQAGVLGSPVTSEFETKYWPLKCLPNDIPIS